jgi:transposase
MEFTNTFFNLILDFGDDWKVTKVEVNHKNKEVKLHLDYVGEHYLDPESREVAVLYDHTDYREWRHLDILQYKSYVSCRIPRVKCKDGKVRQVSLDWADKHDRHTYQFEFRVIDLLLATKNQSKTASFLDCSFRLVNRVMHRCTERGMQRRKLRDLPIEHISIDEKSFKKGHKYATVLSDPLSGCVIDVGEGRSEQSASSLMSSTFTQEQLERINTISMDMWQAFINAAKENCPQAEIVHDKFHLVSYLNKCLDQVRRREVKDNEALNNCRYTLLKNEENLTRRQREKFELIKTANFEVSKVWRIRENFRELFDCYHEERSATAIFATWAYDSFMHKIKEVNKVVMMFMDHLKGVVNALISNLNNAMAERLNGKIQEIKTTGRGYRTFKNFRSAVLFFHGGLNLYPQKW